MYYDKEPLEYRRRSIFVQCIITPDTVYSHVSRRNRMVNEKQNYIYSMFLIYVKYYVVLRPIMHLS